MTRKTFNKLPSVFQTETQRKFFDATFEQAFKKKDVEKLDALIGRRVSGSYDPLNDYYKPEINKDRTRYQLEPIVSASNDTRSINNFYYDFKNYLSVNGSVSESLSFESEFYSYSPPIDIDKFINYQNYYWVSDISDVPIIEVISTSAILDDQYIEDNIIGQLTYHLDQDYVINGEQLEQPLQFSTGLIVSFPDSDQYSDPHIIEGVGRSISLVPVEEQVVLSGGQVNVESPDYFTITRGALNGNLWSRTNRWIHVEAIETNNLFSGVSFQETSVRATRPIIEYLPNIELFDFGTEFGGVYDYFYDGSISDIDGQSTTNANSVIGHSVSDGQSIVIGVNVYDISISSNTVQLQLVNQIGDDRSVQILLGSGTSDGLYYVVNSGAMEVSSNQKGSENIMPLFSLYDIDGNSLSDHSVYSGSNFTGSSIFMYRESDEGELDSELGIRVEYYSLPQVSEIIFENKLISERFTYITGNRVNEIGGYYFYYNIDTDQYENSWYTSDVLKKQRAIEKFTTLDSGETAFRLESSPNNGENDIRVTVNGTDGVSFDYVEHNNEHWINVTGTNVPQNSDIEVSVRTDQQISNNTNAYYEIPSQLFNNPFNEEVNHVSYGQISPHFTSIIKNQGENIDPRARNNGYRDSAMDLSVGEYILHTNTPAPLAMMINDESLDIVKSIQYSMNEYEAFKSKFIKYINMISDYQSDIGGMKIHDALLQVIDIVRASREYSESFSMGYMLPCGPSTVDDLIVPTVNDESAIITYVGDGMKMVTNVSRFSEVTIDNLTQGTTLTNSDYHVNEGSILVRNQSIGDQLEVQIKNVFHQLSVNVDVSDPTNIIHCYQVDDMMMGDYQKQRTLLSEVDYRIIDNIIYFSSDMDDSTIMVKVYINPEPCYIPVTPSKMGISPLYVPHIMYDDSYVQPTYVIVGHDGSKTPVYGQYQSSDIDTINNYDNRVNSLLREYDNRDILLLELEREIYNSAPSAFKSDVYPIHSLNESISTPLQESRYDYSTFVDINKEEFFLWTAVNELDFESNLTFDSSDWKTWNYGNELELVWDGNNYILGDKLPGSWRGIYLKYFRTTQPNKPWEMLGISIKPSWWDECGDIGDGFTGYGGDYSQNNITMWSDIEHGIIRRGDKKGISPYTYAGLCGDQTIFNTPPMNNGELRDVITNSTSVNNLIPLDSSGNLKSITDLFPHINFNEERMSGAWSIGDLSPVEYAWMNTSAYQFSKAISYYYLRPFEFSYIFHDTINTRYVNGQIVDISTGFRPDIRNKVYHGEEGNVLLGNITWISDMILSDSASVTERMGTLIRNSEVKLGNKIGGFTQRDGIKLYLDNVTVGGDMGGLMIPQENYDVQLFTGSPINVSEMSGVLVRLNDGKYQVYGYSTKQSSFKYFPRKKTKNSRRITRGGTPESFVDFDYDSSYQKGTLVNKNGSFYRAKTSTTSGIFNSNEWSKLNSLPTNGGITVTLNPDGSNEEKELGYGKSFDNVQDLYDFIIGYGAYLESNGWVYDNVDDSGMVDDWRNSADKLLFWLSSNWQDGNALSICPGSTGIKYVAPTGYPDKLLSNRNGSFNILDKYGLPIDYRDLIIDRNENEIVIKPRSLGDGINFVRVYSIESEHILTVDSTTLFNDIVYQPVLGTRQPRLRFVGERTNGWYGKVEAPGFLVDGDDLLPNFDSLPEMIRGMHTESSGLPTEIMEASRYMIGHYLRDYMDQLSMNSDTQYNFYQGFLKEKGTASSIYTILRASKVFGSEDIKYNEEWAIKVGDFGSIDNEILITFSSKFKDINTNPQPYRLNFSSAESFFIQDVVLYDSTAIYSSSPQIVVDSPLDGEVAELVAVLGNDRRISEIQVVNAGSGYTSPPSIVISDDNIVVGSPSIAYPIMGRDFTPLNTKTAIDIDINDQDEWIYSSKRIGLSGSIPTIGSPKYGLPTAGFVHLNDVNHTVYSDLEEMKYDDEFNFNVGEYVWVAKNAYDDWSVYSIDEKSYTIDDDLILTTFSRESSFNNIKRSYGMAKFDLFTDVFGSEYYVSEMPVFSLVDDEIILSKLIHVQGDQYRLLDSEDQEVDLEKLSAIYSLENRRFREVPNYVLSSGELIWVDNGNDGKWEVLLSDGSQWISYRKKESVIDTSKFKIAKIHSDSVTDVSLPIFDPVKGILNGPVEKSINYKTYTDPAVYNNDSPSNLTMNDSNVGEIWLDLSDTLFIDYEQPASIDESIDDVIGYRNKNWGSVFPNCPASVYQWVESNVVPSQYVGDGTPRNMEEYVTIRKWNNSSRTTTVKYYFWVSGANEPMYGNTLSISQISNIIRSPRGQGGQWYTPIYTDGDTVVVTYNNVSNFIGDSDARVDLSYTISDELSDIHTKWTILRDDDKFSRVPSKIWDKAIDSLIGYTDILEDVQFDRSFSVGSGSVIPVPDPLLLGDNKFGVDIRPQQTLIDDNYGCRNIVKDKINSSIYRLRLWEPSYTQFFQMIEDSDIFDYVDWVDERFVMRTPNYSVEELSEMYSLGPSLSNGDVIRVYPFNPEPDDLYEMYVYRNGEFILVVRENGTIRLNDNFVDINSSAQRKVDVRTFINGLLDYVFIGDNITLSNNLFFSILNFIMSEQRNVDWAFKTSFISIVQDGLEISQGGAFNPNNIDMFVDYFNETKPYHTKIRDVITTYSIYDEVTGTILEDLDMDIYLEFSRHNQQGYVFYEKDISDRWNDRDWDDGKWNESNPSDIYSNVTQGDDYILDNSNKPEELISLDVNENMIIDLKDDVVVIRNGAWDGQWPWDVDIPEIELGWDNDIDSDLSNIMEFSYRMHLSSYTESIGSHHVVRNVNDDGIIDQFDATLIEDVEIGNIDYIIVDSVDKLPTNGDGHIWVGKELMSFKSWEEEGTNIKLTGIRRAIKGTSMYDHPIGTGISRGDVMMDSHVSFMDSGDGFGSEYDIRYDQDVHVEQYRDINIARFLNGIPVDSSGQPTENVEYVPAVTSMVNPWYYRVNCDEPPFESSSSTGYRNSVYTKASLFLLRYFNQ